MSDTPTARVRANTPRPQQGRFVFWMLILLALGAFAPCVLLPQWRQYQALCRAEQVQQHRVNLLEQQVERESRLLMALRSDPAVIARLARREYRFHRPGERTMPVPVSQADPAPNEAFIPKPVALPPVLARVGSYLPDYDYDRVFCDDQARPVVLVMSVVLIVVAFSLFSRRGEDTNSA